MDKKVSKKSDLFSKADVRKICEQLIDEQGTVPIGLNDLLHKTIKCIKAQRPSGVSRKERKHWRKAVRALFPIFKTLLPELMAEIVLVVDQKPMKLVSRRQYYRAQHSKRKLVESV